MEDVLLSMIIVLLGAHQALALTAIKDIEFQMVLALDKLTKDLQMLAVPNGTGIDKAVLDVLIDGL